MEWIKSSERMPLKEGFYLTYSLETHFGYYGFFVSSFDGDEFKDWPPNCGCTGQAKPDYWRPLPPAPIEEKK